MNQYLENTEGLEKDKIRIFVVSSVDDLIKIHINVFELKDKDMEEITQGFDGNILDQEVKEIIDTRKLTNKLTIDEINQHWLKSIYPGINASQIIRKSKEDSQNLQSSIIEINHDSVDECFGLDVRRKNEKLSEDQINYIKSKFINTGVTIQKMQSEYNISYSVLNRIRKSALDQQDRWKHRKLIKVYGSQKDTLVKYIKNYVLNAKGTLTAKDVTESINKELRTSHPVSFIRNMMKRDVNLSFKRVKSRPNNVDFKRVHSIRSLFAVKFSKIVSEKSLLINIDESSINKDVKIAYSWGIKGKPIESQNSSLAGSASIIMAICSNGAWISKVINKTINSDCFIWFLKIMVDWLQSHNYFEWSRVIVLLDNCSIHKSGQTLAVFESLKFATMFIPAYSPEFAPVEYWFSQIKRRLSEIWKRENLTLTLRHNYTKIYDSLVSIKTIIVRRMFKQFYRTIKEHL